MTSRWFSLGLLAAASLIAPAAYPCTTFLAEHAGEPVVGKDYDWDEDAGRVMSNPRGLSKAALTLVATDTPATWLSKYASLTFNQYGAEFPNGGMNEKGLVVEIMWLSSTEYPPSDARPVINELQWIQYALDGYATVAELVPAMGAVRVARAYANVHYLACDATAECAAFEYLGGRLVVTRSADMLAKTLANDTYADSAAYLAGFVDFGGTAAIPSSSDSLARFARASSLARATNNTTIPDSAFAILKSASQSSTQWSLVYVPKQGTAYFRTQRSPTIKSAALRQLPGDCKEPRKMLDINSSGSGDVSSQFVEYTMENNRQLVEESLGSMASSLPTGAVGLVASFPNTYACVGLDGAAGEASGDSNTPSADAPSSAQKSSGCSCSLWGGQRREGLGWMLVAAGLVGMALRRRAER